MLMLLVSAVLGRVRIIRIDWGLAPTTLTYSGQPRSVSEISKYVVSDQNQFELHYQHIDQDLLDQTMLCSSTILY